MKFHGICWYSVEFVGIYWNSNAWGTLFSPASKPTSSSPTDVRWLKQPKAQPTPATYVAANHAITAANLAQGTSYRPMGRRRFFCP
jgi:hypothetical protein